MDNVHLLQVFQGVMFRGKILRTLPASVTGKNSYLHPDTGRGPVLLATAERSW